MCGIAGGYDLGAGPIAPPVLKRMTDAIAHRGPDGEGRLLLVAPNIYAARQALDVDAAEFGMWVCLHEATHRLQFTAVPWMREHLFAEIDAISETLEPSSLLEGGLRLDEDMLGLDTALTRLHAVEPRLTQVVELRYFAGLSELEIAALLQRSERSVRRDWQKARMFLLASLKETPAA